MNMPLALQLPTFNSGAAQLLAASVLGLVCVPGFIVLYRAEHAALTRARRGLLIALRLLLVAAGLVMIARPAALLVEKEVHDPVLPILIDTSKSMSYPDARDNPLTVNNPRQQRRRFDGVFNAAKDMVENLSPNRDMRLYAFSDNLQSLGDKPVGALENLLRLKPVGEYSNISDAVCTTLENFSDRKLAGIVVVSDGRQTGGRDKEEAIRLAKSARVPVHTVMLGNEFPLLDLRIDEISASPDVSLGDVLVLNVAVTNQIAEGLKLDAKLMLGNQEVANKPLTLKRGASRFSLCYLAEKEGEFDFRVVLPALDGEVDTTNNEAACHVRVIKHSLRTLLIAGLPNLEYHYLVPALMRDPVLEVSTFLQSADIDYVQQGNTTIEALPKTLKQWEDYDVIILYDPDPNKLTSAQISGIEHAVMKGRGLLFVAGRNYGLTKLIQIHGPKIRALLPVEIEVNAPPDYERLFETPLKVQRTAIGRSHPLMLCDSRAEVNEKVWESFPPLYWYQHTQGLRPGAISLLEIAASDRAGGQPDCLMAVQRYEEGAVFYSGTNAFWNWRFPYGGYDYERFWNRVIRYLGEARLSGKQVQVALSTDKRIYAPGERAKVKLDILDFALFEQLAQAPIFCKVTDPSGGEYMLPMQRSTEGPATYRAEFPPVLKGNTVLRVRQRSPDADSEAKPLFDVSCSFQVEMRSLEELDTSGDLEFMRALAEQTGGHFYCYRNMRELANLNQVVPAEKEVLTRERRREVWDTWPWLLAMLALAATEWSLRKIWGLL